MSIDYNQPCDWSNVVNPVILLGKKNNVSPFVNRDEKLIFRKENVDPNHKQTIEGSFKVHESDNKANTIVVNNTSISVDPPGTFNSVE